MPTLTVPLVIPSSGMPAATSSQINLVLHAGIYDRWALRNTLHRHNDDGRRQSWIKWIDLQQRRTTAETTTKAVVTTTLTIKHPPTVMAALTKSNLNGLGQHPTRMSWRYLGSSVREASSA